MSPLLSGRRPGDKCGPYPPTVNYAETRGEQAVSPGGLAWGLAWAQSCLEGVKQLQKRDIPFTVRAGLTSVSDRLGSAKRNRIGRMKGVVSWQTLHWTKRVQCLMLP